MGLQIKSRIRVGANMVFAAAMLLLSGTSCIKEHPADGGTPLKPDEAEVVMRLRTPGSFSSSGGTRGLTVAQENDIDDIYVLVFDKDDKLSDIKQGRDISTPGGGAFNVRTFTATFAASRTDLDKYNLVVLANAASVLTATIGTDFGSFSGSKAYADIWPRLTAAITGKMFASGGTIPMWGETGQIVVQAGASANVELPLHRAIARIDVGVGVPTTITDATGAKEYEWTNPTAIPFAIDEVYVFRPDDKYSLIPDPANFSTTDPKKATAPTVPSLSTRFTTDVSEDKFKFDGVEITGGLYTTQSIYVPEADIRMGVSGKPGDANHENRMAVIVGGSYSGTAKSYYRIDFVKDGNLIDVLRNHLYQFNIKAVTGPGYPDPETAYKSLAMNMTAEVIAWHEAEITDVVFNGQNYLSLRPGSEIEFFKDADNKTVSVKTDVAEGWKITKITESDGTTPNTGWLTTDRTVGTLYTGVDVYMPINVSVSDNTTGSTRIGYIYLTAGRLTQVVKVTQNMATNSFLTITDGYDSAIDAIEFAAASGDDPGEMIFKVKWSPKAETLYPAISAVAKPVGGGNYDAPIWNYYNTESGAISAPGTTVYTSAIDSKTGEATFTIKPNAITTAEMGGDPFYERQTMVSFRATGSEGTMRKSIILQQYVYNMTAKAESFFLADGSSYTFNVKSNRPWKAYLIDDGDTGKGGIVASPAVNASVPFATGGYNLPGSTDVSFKTVDDLANPTIFSGTAKVKIVWDDGTGTDATQTIDLFCASGVIQPESNTYLVKPGGIGILIPVDRANDHVADAISAADPYTAELVWTDNSNRIAANSNIRLIQAIGTGSSGYILVMPGTAEGNAVVAVKVGGVTKWSWHVWVTNFELPASPASGTFLNRNLGALSNTAGLGSLGLMYQWGRKDPFPGSAALAADNVEPTIYNASGTTTITKTPVAANPNLNNAVANPATFYCNVNTPNDWYSNTTAQNNALWGTSKTPYDPCPVGWKVPVTGVWGSLTTGNFIWSTAGGNGRTNASVGGWYPAAGLRNLSTGALATVGTSGYCWSASINGTNVYNLYFISTNVFPASSGNRANGLSVRCVAE